MPTMAYSWHPQFLTILLIGILTHESVGLRDVRVKMPQTIRRGQNVTLKCLFDIEEDTLYSVKWHKGRREFYCYTPNEEPPMKVYPMPGIRINRTLSNETHLALQSASLATAGKYSCEVSADAPSFHTLIAAAELEVVELPHNPPFIMGLRSRYQVGDIIRGNCTSRHSRPAANLTWIVNNEKPSLMRHFKVHKDSRSEMQTSVIGIHFVVNNYHFINGKMKIKCIAQIGDIYYKSTEKVVLNIDYHHSHHIEHEYDNNNNNNNAINMIDVNKDYDHYTLHERQGLRSNDNYVTRVQELSAWFLSNGAATDSNSGRRGSPYLLIALLLYLSFSWLQSKLYKLLET